MKTRNAVLVAAVALFAAQLFAATHTEVTKAPRLPFMRGINFTGWPSGYATDSYATKASTYASLKTMGFDHVRVPIDFRRFTNYDSSTRTATFKDGISTIDTVIDCAEAAGMYVYVDGTHGWKDDLDPRSESVTNQFIAIWKAVAERYKDRSNFVMFELMSEQKTFDSQILFREYSALQNATIAEIRKTNPTRLVIWSSHDGSQPWTLTQAANPPKYGWIILPKNDNNIAVAVHCYSPGEFTHQGQTWAGQSSGQKRLTDEHIETLNKDLKWITQYVEGTGIPVVANEYGVVRSPSDHGDLTTFLSIATRYFESHSIPWSPWVYGSSDVFACFNYSGVMYDYYKSGYFPDLLFPSDFSASNYPHAIDITFSGYAGSSALANFPALVKLSEDAVFGFKYSDFTRADGYDLCFTDASGNLIPHEIDTWNTNGVSTVWVKVPSLTSSTKIVARYGCAKPIVHKVESVWDEDYVGVWHMGEQKLPLADSSNVSRDVTSADGTGIGYGAAGVVGGSVDFGAPGGSRCVNTDDHKELDGFQKMTIEAWTYQTARPTGSDKNTGILGKRNSSSSEASYYLYDSGADQKSAFYVASSGSSPQSAGKLVPTALNTWNHQVHTFDGSLSSDNAKGYLNGAYQGAGTANVSQIFAGAAELHIGNFQSGDSRNFPGKIDEVRISKCVRSADWIKASYDTVAKSSFAKYAVQDVVDQNPTLYVDVPTGEDTVDAAEVKTWTTKILKAGDGTAVFSPVSSTSVTNLEVRCGTVKLATSAPASVVSKIGEHDFAAGTKLDLSGKSYSVATLKGQPTVQDAATFTVAGTWFMKGASAMAVEGALAFGSGSTVLLDEALFASVGHEGVAIATATAGITGMPAFESLDFAIKLSTDGKSLIVYDNIPDVADWTAFTKAVAVTFGGVQNGVTLTNFPVLVKLSTAIEGFSYADFKRSNGEDLRFADSAGNLLAHEIDMWNPNGVSTVWVRIPLLSKDVAITAYYGNLHPVRAAAAKDVWDDDYVGVWHLGESALPMKESSETSSDFTSSYGDTIGYAAQGIVGGSVDFPANGLYNALVAKDHDALDGFSKFTIETWTFQNEHKNNAGILAKRKESNSEAAYYINDTTNNSVMVLNIGTNRSTSALWSIHQAQTVGDWNHIAFTADMASTNKNLHVFKNGAMNGWEPSKVFFGPVPNCASDLYLGNLGANKKDYSFNGRIDEVRISKCVRTKAWVKATYDTIANAGFATYAVTAPPEPAVAAAFDSAGFDYTNRIVTVTNAAAGAQLTLTATASDGTTTTATASVGANGKATFNVETAPGTEYSYTVSQGGIDLATGGFFTGGWDAGGSLFSAAPNGSGVSIEKNGSWTVAPPETNATHYAVSEGADFGLAADAASATVGEQVRVDVAATFDSFDDVGTLSSGELSGRIVGMAPATSGGTAKWMAGVGGEWKELAGGPVPQVDAPYVLRMEADFKSTPPKVRCSVSADAGATFDVLADATTGATWHDVSGAALSGVALDGHGGVISLSGALANSNVAEADGVGYASLADAIAAATNSLVLLTNATWPTNTPVGTVTLDRGGFAVRGVALDGNDKVVVQSGYSEIKGEGRVNIALTQVAALGVATADKTPAQIAAALAANGANGIPRWKSYVLGLDPADAAAQPKATIAMNGDNVELALVGIDVNAASGATVSYKVYKFADLADMAAAEAVGGDRAVDATAEVPKDASAPKMLYRLKVDVKGY